MNNMKENKNILHIFSIFFSLTYLGEQFKYFSKKGYNQHVICSASAQLFEYSKSQKVKYKEVDIERKIVPITDLIANYKICRYIRKNKIRIVVGHSPKGALLAMISAFVMRVPKRIYFRHGLVYETMHGFPRILMINIDRITAYCATQVVCVSPSLAEQSILDHLNPEKKQLVLGNGTCSGIDATWKFNPKLIDQIKANRLRESFNIDKSAFVIGYCGRLVRDKGIIDLVKGFKTLKSKLPNKNIKLLLIGDFEERDSLLPDLIEEIKLSSDIIYTGVVYKAIEYYYSLMNVFILPSYREGFPTVTLEAASMELPVLTTKVTGCIDSIKEGKTGFYIQNDPESIASKLYDLFNDTNLKQYGINGRKMVLESFENTIIWPIIESRLYNSSNLQNVL
jgi:glycosyltransferase involved in cell wall biosynthesis